MTVEDGYSILNTGAHMPKIGLGTWKSQGHEVENAVKCALFEGYRHIDCAFLYENEKEVGKSIAASIDSGIVKREDIFITSKLSTECLHPDKVESSCKISLENLGLDYLDLYLIHWPVATKDFKPLDLVGIHINFIDTWKEMEKLVSKGYVKAIGVSNFNEAQLEELLTTCQIKPAVNQVEVQPYLNNQALIKYCESKDITVVAYSPFASPDPGRPEKKDDDPEPLKDPLIKGIADKHQVGTDQVILRWLLQKNLIAIPKSVTPSRIKRNIQIKNLQLNEEDIEKMDGLNIPFRSVRAEIFQMSKYYPFK